MSVSIAFFIVGLIPDFATVRDRAKGLTKFFYGFLALGFRGTNHQWVHYLRGYLLFAALATPLVFSVHSIVSWDFAMSSIPAIIGNKKFYRIRIGYNCSCQNN